MVGGMGRFLDHFSAYADRYVLIGGAAVDMLMDRAGIDFRLTKDLDVVLLVESLDAEFGATFWEFISAGGYEHRHKSSGAPCFYRFHSPSDDSFPYMIELFARRDGLIQLPADAVIGPLPVDEEVSSLSAIMLDDDYYDFVRSGAEVVEGVPLFECYAPDSTEGPCVARFHGPESTRRGRPERSDQEASRRRRAPLPVGFAGRARAAAGEHCRGSGRVSRARLHRWLRPGKRWRSADNNRRRDNDVARSVRPGRRMTPGTATCVNPYR